MPQLEGAPAPLLPADVDLRDFEFMPLMVRRFRDSALVATRSPEEVLAAVMLWCASWHQVPAASLPSNDAELAQLAGYGRGVTDFLRIKDGAMHGLVLCTDGRYWHQVVADQAADSWNSKLDQRHRKACDRMRKFNREREERKESPWPMPDRGARLVPTTSDGITRYFLVGADGVPIDDGRSSKRLGRRNSRLKGQGHGQGQGLEKKKGSEHASRLAPQGVQQETWDAWLTRKGKAQTAEADRIQRKRIGEWLEAGFDVNRIVEDALAGNWQGLHAPDRRAGGRPTLVADRHQSNIDSLTGKTRNGAIEGVAGRVDRAVVLTLPGGVREPSADDVEGRGPGGSEAGVG